MKFLLRYGLFALAFLCAAALFCALSRWELPEAPTREGDRIASVPERVAGTLRVASLNCRNYLATNRYTDDARYKRYWAKPQGERAALRKLIKQVNPDVLAFQEIGGNKQLAQLQRDLKRENALDFPYSVCLDGRDEKRKIAFLSRVPFERVFKFEETEHLSRGLLGVQVRLGSASVNIFTVHLKSKLARSKDDPECNAERLGEAQRIREILEQAGTETFVLLGDFNDFAESPPVHVFTNWARCRRLDLQDTFGRRWTYRNFKGDYKHTFDHCFISNTLGNYYVPESGKIADEGMACLQLDGRLIHASDHRMIFADFLFPQQKTEKLPEKN